MKPASRPDLAHVDFDDAPFLVIWETTQACDLACLHCRAEARPYRDLGELDTIEAMKMMNQIRRFGRSLFVLTGGDPFKRPDLVELVEHGSQIGLRMGLTPSATPLVTPERLAELKEAGVGRFAMSLDGATARTHDRFRGVPGSFDLTLAGLREARRLGIPTQVNTTLTRDTFREFDDIVRVVSELGVTLWSVFFLVPVGRGQTGDVLSADAFEEAFHRMAEVADRASFDIKSTAAPHYRRVLMQRRKAERKKGRTGGGAPSGLALPSAAPFSGPGFLTGARARGVNDGNGFLFISHRGDLYPSGFLPLSRGNVRTHDPVEVYRHDGLFQALRDPDRLEGKCGVCEYRTVCGGSRARAWALTGNPLAQEPYCSHIPKGWDPTGEPRQPVVRRLPMVGDRATCL